MNPLHYLFRPFYNYEFKKFLKRYAWCDASMALELSLTPFLEITGQAEWTEHHYSELESLLDKYDSKGTCKNEDYSFVSKKLKSEYDVIHSLIRALIGDDQLHDYVVHIKNNPSNNKED